MKHTYQNLEFLESVGLLPRRSVGEWLVNEEVLTDASKVYNVVGYQGDLRITFYCVDKGSAEFVAMTLNEAGTVTGCAADHRTGVI